RDDESVLSGKTMKQIAVGSSRVWQSSRVRQIRNPKSETRKNSEGRRPDSGIRIFGPPSAFVIRPSELSRLPRQSPAYVSPMKALLVRNPPPRDNWLFEIKWDGYRAIAVKTAGKVKLYSRRHRDITDDFKVVAEAVAALSPKNVVLDGEIVALDNRGRPSFQLLQNFRHAHSQRGSTLCYYVFDILNYDSRDLKKLPLETRRRILESLLAGAKDPIRLSATIAGEPEQLVAQAKRNGIEGLVAKRANSIYEPDRRSGSWLKIKTVLEQEFVIGGYTAPKGSREHFGSLLVGYYKARELIFASKVGTGFNAQSLESLHNRFKKLETTVCPFVNLPSKGPNGLSRSEMKRCTWLLPTLVCQVGFTEWTGDGGLRHPVFLGLRDDKRPSEVVRETPQ
ncbi:MAG: non-homologous end-joining DNA ligase, partial [Verrucomicrobia subdivision 3 bacterium]|nr:non-homologous end-joining DNA ligase [Limisphaerales bacterium]